MAQNVDPRKLLTAVLAGAIGVLPVMPPEHAHETASPDGHHHLTLHRHTGDHLWMRQHGGGPVLDDRDPVLTLDLLFTAPARTVVSAPVLTAVDVPVPPAGISSGPQDPFVECLIHGPPRAPTDLRGPPLPTCL
jgi:hypothetical protein